MLTPKVPENVETGWVRAPWIAGSTPLQVTVLPCPGTCLVAGLAAGTSSRMSLDQPCQGQLSPVRVPAAPHKGVTAQTRPHKGEDEGKQADSPQVPKMWPLHSVLVLSVQTPHGDFKAPLRRVAAGETEAQWIRGLQQAPCGGRSHFLLLALGSHYHTALPDLLGVTPADLTSSVGENLTCTLHRSPGATVPAEGSISKTQGLAFTFWNRF